MRRRPALSFALRITARGILIAKNSQLEVLQVLVLRRSEELSFGDVLSPGSSAGEQAHGELGFKRLGNGKRGYLSRHCFPIFDTGQPLGVLLSSGLAPK